MNGIILAVLVVGGILVLTELLWREGLIPRSKGRVTVHILVACWIAIWPYFLSTYAIIALAALMFAMVTISRTFRIFEAIHRTKRWTVGEFLYPLAIALSAYLAPTSVIFTAAVLQLGLADGLASVIGDRLKYRPYHILGQNKSVGGSMAFFITSLVITLIVLMNFAEFGFAFIAVLTLIPVLSTAAENISVFGLDDLTVPMISLVLLSSLL